MESKLQKNAEILINPILADLSSSSNLVFSNSFLWMLALARKERTLHVSNIIDVLKRLNKDISVLAKKGNTFKHQGLIGYSKLHYTQPLFNLHSIANFWSKEDRFIRAYHTILNKHSNLDVANSVFATEFTVNTFKRLAKNNKLTGEWIVFKLVRDKAFVLCLAKHSEENKEIRQRIDIAVSQGFVCHWDNDWVSFDYEEFLQP